MSIRFSLLSEADLETIGDHIADDNPQRAVTFVREMRERCLTLAGQPAMGVPRPDYGDGIRMLIHGRYLIFYAISSPDVLILRILHSARDTDSFFNQ